MTGKNLRSITSAGLLAAVIGAASVMPAVSSPVGAPLPPGHRRPHREHPDRSPHLRAALRALMNAQRHLTMADHDSAGHREQALDLVQRAIAQCREAITSDR